MISDKHRDYYAGALVFLLGIGTAVMGSTYTVGTLTKMGPGFFPTALGFLMAFMGVLVAAANFLARHKEAAPEINHGGGMQTSPDWRGWGCIMAAVVSFILLAEHAGLVFATFICVFLGCWGDKTARLQDSASLALGISLFGILLFSDILRVQLPAYVGNVPAEILALLGVSLFGYILRAEQATVRDIVYGVCVTAWALAMTLLGFVLFFFAARLFYDLFSSQASNVQIPGFQDIFLISGLLVLGLPLFSGLLRSGANLRIAGPLFGALLMAFSALESGARSLIGNKSQPSTPERLQASGMAVYGLLFYFYVLLMQIFIVRGM